LLIWIPGAVTLPLPSFVTLSPRKVHSYAAQVEIVQQTGLHARPAALFVQCVIRFRSTVSIDKDGERYSAASILEVLAANLDCGARIIIEAVGPDEKEALDELEALLRRLPEEEAKAGSPDS
jgi:phosphocarrier protein